MLSLKYVLNSKLNAISYSKNVQEMTPARAFREKVNSGLTPTCEIYSISTSAGVHSHTPSYVHHWCATFQANTCKARKLVIDKTFV